MKFKFQAIETSNVSANLERASYKRYPIKREDTTPALRDEYTAKRALYAKERDENQRAREAPMMAVSGHQF
jgi:hypothetical protein